MWNPFKKNYTKVELLETRLKEVQFLREDEFLGVTKDDDGGATVGIFKPNKE